MSDKKLNQATEAADANYIYAENANGELIKIKKSDLATLVAGMLGNIYGYRGDIKTGEDLDNIKANGFYFVHSSHGITNSPIDSNIGFALININVNYFFTQICIYENTFIYCRSKWGDSMFTNWKKIAFTE